MSVQNLKMKYFVVFALCVAAASAFVLPPTVSDAEASELQQIIDAIYHPSTDPATSAALEQMLLEILGLAKPEVVEENQQPPISVGPAIIDESIVSEPGQENLTPIDVGPAIIDESIVSEPANYRPPLVQVIVNVNTNAPGNADVVVENPTPVEIEPTPVIVVEQPEIEATPVEVVEQPEVPEPVIVAPVIVPEEPAEVPTPVIVSPIETMPVVNLPGILN